MNYLRTILARASQPKAAGALQPVLARADGEVDDPFAREVIEPAVPPPSPRRQAQAPRPEPLETSGTPGREERDAEAGETVPAIETTSFEKRSQSPRKPERDGALPVRNEASDRDSAPNRRAEPDPFGADAPGDQVHREPPVHREVDVREVVHRADEQDTRKTEVQVVHRFGEEDADKSEPAAKLRPKPTVEPSNESPAPQPTDAADQPRRPRPRLEPPKPAPVEPRAASKDAGGSAGPEVVIGRLSIEVVSASEAAPKPSPKPAPQTRSGLTFGSRLSFGLEQG